MKRRLHVRNVAGFLAAAALSWMGPSQIARAKDNPPPRSNDITTWDLASFFDFLNGHQDLREQLNRDPRLVKNQQFLQDHPDLQTYLQQHPAVTEEIKESPREFMEQENRYAQLAYQKNAGAYRPERPDADDRGDRDRDRRDADGRRDFNDLDRDDRARFGNRGELARFDQFLDGHREIAEQLRRNPALANNQQFLQTHPALQSFLQSHPGISQQLAQNPDAFMQRENRYDAREEFREGDRDRDRMGNRCVKAKFDRFLDKHPDIERDLRKNPPQADNEEYVKAHPALQAFYQEHPEVRHEISLHENAFMRAENRYDAREEAREGDRDRDRNRGVLATFDRFLDQHPDIERDLRKNPPQADNEEYVKAHPALQAFYQEHPEVRHEISLHENAFMRAENRYDAREEARNRDRNDDLDLQADNNRRDRDDNRGVRDRDDAVRDRDDAVRDRDDARRGNNNPQGVRGDRDTTRSRDLASFDRFLDSHRETAEQLRRNPSLVNDKQFVQNHPALQAYLQQNQGVREEITENPNQFMRQENQFDRHEDMDRGRWQQAANFREFLSGHASISQELSRDPSKANDPKYLKSRPDFQTYLKAHPDVQTALSQDPHSFMKSVQQPATGTTGTTTGTSTGTTGTTTGTTKPPTTPETKPPKP